MSAAQSATKIVTAADMLEWLYGILDSETLSSEEFGLLSAIAMHFNRTTGDCYPSLPRLAAKLLTSESTVRRVRERLKAAGVLDWVAGAGKRPTLYNLPGLEANGDRPQRKPRAKLTAIQGGKPTAEPVADPIIEPVKALAREPFEPEKPVNPAAPAKAEDEIVGGLAAELARQDSKTGGAKAAALRAGCIGIACGDGTVTLRARTLFAHGEWDSRLNVELAAAVRDRYGAGWRVEVLRPAKRPNLRPV